MAEIRGRGAITSMLQKRGKLVGNARVSVTVGYRAPYAVFVHENMQANHPTGKAKFLVDPMRRLRNELHDIIRGCLKRGMSLEAALTVAGNRLKRESQLECPVDTGFLRNSAFVSTNPGTR